MLIIFFVQLLLPALFQGTCFPFWTGCRMRLLRDVTRKPRALLWQPALKYIRAFSFQCTLALLLKGWCFCIRAGLLSSELSGASGTREAALCPCSSGGALQALAQSLSLQVLPLAGATAPSPPKASAQSLPAVSDCRAFTGSCDCPQETPQCHTTDGSDFLNYFFFNPLVLAQAVAAASLIMEHGKYKIWLMDLLDA